MHHCPGYSSIPKADKKRAFHFFMAHFERAPLPSLRYSHMVFWRIHGSPMHSFGWPWMSPPIRQFSITLLAHVASKLGKRTSASVYKLLILGGRCHYVRPMVLFSSDMIARVCMFQGLFFDHVENAMCAFVVAEITDPLLWISMVVCRSWKQSRSPHPSLISLDYLLISMRVGESSYTGSSPSNGCAGPSVNQGCVIYAGGGELVHRRFAACGVGDAFRGRRFRHPHSFGRFRRRYIRHLRGVWGVS